MASYSAFFCINGNDSFPFPFVCLWSSRFLRGSIEKICSDWEGGRPLQFMTKVPLFMVISYRSTKLANTKKNERTNKRAESNLATLVNQTILYFRIRLRHFHFSRSMPSKSLSVWNTLCVYVWEQSTSSDRSFGKMCVEWRLNRHQFLPASFVAIGFFIANRFMGICGNIKCAIIVRSHWRHLRFLCISIVT